MVMRRKSKGSEDSKDSCSDSDVQPDEEECGVLLIADENEGVRESAGDGMTADSTPARKSVKILEFCLWSKGFGHFMDVCT